MAGSERYKERTRMTKKQYKDKITRLESRIGEMQEQVVHCRRQAKLLDEEDSKKLLEKYHIESEELAELIYRHQQENRKKAAENADQMRKAAAPETVPEPEIVAGAEAKPVPETKTVAEIKQGSEPVPRRAAKAVPTAAPQDETAPGQAEAAPATEPQPNRPVNPLDMFK